MSIVQLLKITKSTFLFCASANLRAAKQVGLQTNRKAQDRQAGSGSGRKQTGVDGGRQLLFVDAGRQLPPRQLAALTSEVLGTDLHHPAPRPELPPPRQKIWQGLKNLAIQF